MQPQVTRRGRALLAAALFTAAPSLAQDSYEFLALTGPTGVGFDEVFNLNDRGAVVGNVMTPGGRRPAVWSPETGLVQLSGFSSDAVATAINNRGQIVGSFTQPGSFSGTPVEAFLWDNGVISTFAPLAGDPVTAGVDITEDGRVLVSSGFENAGPNTTAIASLFITDGAGLMDEFLGVFPAGVSANGTISGSREIIQAGTLIDLEIPAGQTRARAFAVNDSGIAAGSALLDTGGFGSDATPYYWDQNQNAVLIPVPNTLAFGAASDINNRGQIVGRADQGPFRFTIGGSVLDIQSAVINTPAGLRVREANFINERSQILGVFDDGNFFNDGAFLLTPVDDLGTTFCEPGITGNGITATLGAVGSPVAANNDVTLEVVDATDGFGLFILSSSAAAPSPLGDGFLCLGPPFTRIAPVVNIVDGRAELDLDLAGLGIGPGDQRFFQFWFRDSGSSGVNLSQGLQVSFQ